MANEAVIINLGPNGGRVMRMTCADAGIEKGTILKLTDPRTVAACSADNDMFGGIAAEEKVSGDGKTDIAVYTEGIFDLLSTAAGITAGNMVSIGGANQIKIYTTLDGEIGYGFGKALETCAAAEVMAVAIGGMFY